MNIDGTNIETEQKKKASKFFVGHLLLIRKILSELVFQNSCRFRQLAILI